jgi:hypothetical protein
MRSSVDADSIPCRKSKMGAPAPALRRTIAIVLAVAALCSAVAGCVSDMGAPTAENSGSSQLRYYGGPKYPMWSAQ